MSFRDKSARSHIPHVDSSINLITDDEQHSPRGWRAAANAWHWFLIVLAKAGLLRAFTRSSFSSKSVPLHHVDEAQMLAYLDGELPVSGAELVTSHLQSCWSCRSELRVIRTQIKSFLANRDTKLPQSSSPLADRIGELRRRLTGKDTLEI